jgi:hypothetical protein
MPSASDSMYPVNCYQQAPLRGVGGLVKTDFWDEMVPEHYHRIFFFNLNR